MYRWSRCTSGGRRRGTVICVLDGKSDEGTGARTKGCIGVGGVSAAEFRAAKDLLTDQPRAGFDFEGFKFAALWHILCNTVNGPPMDSKNDIQRDARTANSEVNLRRFRALSSEVFKTRYGKTCANLCFCFLGAKGEPQFVP